MDILIVGAGPSGLTVANVLAAYGVPFRIVDAKPGPVSQSRAAIVHVRTLELFDRLGLAGEARRRGLPITHAELYENGRRGAEVPLAGRDGGPIALGQDETERLLVERLAERGHAVEWNTTLTTFGGSRWVVGADGASSQVRRAMGVGFAGRTYEQTGLLADVRLDTRLKPGRLRLNLTRGGFVGMLPLGESRYRLFGAVPRDLAAPGPDGRVSHDPYAEVSLEQLQRWFDTFFAVRARLVGADWTALFRVHSRMAERFRAGDTFLVGDAAHIHSPAGGQGMNLGIGDAVNLGWKLAMVARGEAGEQLLDSYEAERMPVARKVLNGADRGFALEATGQPVAAWLRAHVAGRLLGPLSHLPPVREAIARMFSQTWISYRDSPVVGGSRHGALRPGDRAPLGMAPADLRHHLVVSPGAHVDAPFEIHEHPAAGRLAYLVRPDGHLAYIGPPASVPTDPDRVG
ncbi:FAD-dependent monooxygenase [Nonomuraea africana]|uniref:2-polyprenyl-6-methoxyphenol hydroxylase-like FAD-dependent oxidoreductase n=1 Tax=Nonomuraea africana TaxID=46171 RepID=A0ABR9KEI1_9ACTN|nr:FAD-dependent monooxygenase [Nonomuraea africana]MBE1560438.1 2-polyprenyl-6-methoxyphenol hydroxylase-like FAD-dependent oxidoreductase [Nonomuraea africana]